MGDLEKELVEKIAEVKTYDPSEVRQLQVLRDDWRIAFGWHASQVRGKVLHDSQGRVISPNQVFNTACKIFLELVRRGGTRFTAPSAMKNKVSANFFAKILKKVVGGHAIYLVEPHGKLAWEGKKKLIVKKKKFTSYSYLPLYLVADEKCYGVVRLDYPEKITLRTFQSLREKHLISEKERKKWWPRTKELYKYDFEFVVKFPKPIEVKTKPGIQTFVSDLDVNFKEVSDEKLISEIQEIETKLKRNSSDQLWDKYILSYVELKRRGLDSEGSEFSRVAEDFLKSYAPVHSDTSRKRPKITKEEVLDNFKSFQIRNPEVMVVGGIAVNGETEGDIDILIRGSQTLPEDILVPIKFRIYRQFCNNPKLKDRLHFLDDNYVGPFTSYIPIYALTCERINPENEVIQMKVELEKSAIRSQNPEAADDAEWSKKNDKLRPLHFFYPLKTALSIMAYREAEVFSLDQAVSYIKALSKRKKVDWVPVVVEKKYD